MSKHEKAEKEILGCLTEFIRGGDLYLSVPKGAIVGILSKYYDTPVEPEHEKTVKRSNLPRLNRMALDVRDEILENYDIIPKSCDGDSADVQSIVYKYFEMISQDTPVEPEFKTGRWVMTNKHKNLVMLIGEKYNYKAKKWQNEFLDIKGIKYSWSKMITYHPHIFTEKDLELLNMGEVKYSILYDIEKRPYIHEQRGNNYIAHLSMPTAHEAIAEVFTQTTAMNLLRSKFGDKNEC